jgi:flagellar hook-associated protein 2
VSLSAPGIGSNLDINSIISQLMAVESRPLQNLATKQASHKAKLTALGSLQGALGAFQISVNDLTKSPTFQSMNVSSSDTAIIKASSGNKSAAGSYSINVSQLAQAQSLAATGQASTTATIGTGTATTVRFQFGTANGTSFTENPNLPGGAVTIDSTNNSLQGIRDAINNAKLGVTATIVSDGSASPHRLVVTSDKTGEASSMKISVDGEVAISDLLAYDPTGTKMLTQTSAAQDAQLTVNGISVRSPSNEIKDAISGVTLSAIKTGTATVNVSRDTASITSAVTGFAKAYNDLNRTLGNLTAYNPETRRGGALVGDSTVRSIQTGIRGMLNAAPDNAGNLKHLSEIGVTFQKDGTLAVDSSKLQKAIDSNIDDIAALFATMGKATDSLVSFQGASAATKAGEYEVFVTSLATQGKTAGSAPASLLITENDNDALSVMVNGITASVKLTAGSYTVENLVSHVQSVINGTKAFADAGVAVTVSADVDGKITVASNTYGPDSKVEINGSGAEALLGAARSATTGTDVQGTIGGVAAAGSGQELKGAAGSDAEGLRLLIAGGAENAPRGTIAFSYGYAHQLSEWINSYLDSDGLIKARTDGLNSSIKDLERQSEAINRRLEAVEKRYRAQFTALDTMISSMNQTGTYLAQQLANLPKIG